MLWNLILKKYGDILMTETINDIFMTELLIFLKYIFVMKEQTHI